MANVENLPIDIYYNKLLDWLIDRKWTRRDWQAAATEIRGLITEAIKDMPDVPEITKLLSGSFINYFHCKRIVELLKVSEANTRNIFGRYSSQRMKDWLEIVTRYEPDVYLGELANIIQHNVNYEIPSLQRTIARCQAKLVDCDRKETEYGSMASQHKARFDKICKDMGIEGKDISEELLGLKARVPALLEEAARQIQAPEFLKAIEYYKAFVQFSAGEELADVCKLLLFVHKHGNSSVHKFRTGEELPEDDCVVVSSADAAETGDAGGGIDWGDDAGGGGIDWGDDGGSASIIEVAAADAATDDAGGIDWGDGGDTAAAAGGDGDGIDWGDTVLVEAPAAGDGGIDWGDGGDAGGDGGIDWGDEGASVAIVTESSGHAVTTREAVLEHSETRNQLIDELMELQGFLQQRAAEAGAEFDVATASIFQGAPKLLQSQTQASILAMRDVVAAVENHLTCAKTQQLILIAASPKYVQRLASSLQQKLELSGKMKEKIAELDTLREQARQQIAETQPSVDMLLAQTKELKHQVEQDLSEKYKGRQVNIIGEINAMLAAAPRSS